MNFLAKIKKASNSASAPNQDRLVRFLSQPLLLEEAGPPKVLVQLLGVVSLLVVGLIGFAALTEISESAVVQGQVKPAGSVNLVQHLEGGIVAEIHVEEGAIVERGDRLITLEGAAAQAELEQMRAREASLALRAERLRAFVLDRMPYFFPQEAPTASAPEPASEPEPKDLEPDIRKQLIDARTDERKARLAALGQAYPELAEDQSSILGLQIQARDSQRQVIQSRVEQRQAQLEALVEQKSSLKEQVAIIREQVGMRKKLLKKGLVSRVVYLETARALSKAQGELASLVGQEMQTRASLGEAQNSLLELNAKLRNEALDEMGSVTAELAQVREAIAKLQDRFKRLVIVAPTRGIVKGFTTRTLGAVIGPGQRVLEIVPLDDMLVAEVRISPRDVGHLRQGQLANVKFTTYDPARFGVVEGRLKRVSASTFEDERGEPYFKGIIELNQSYVGSDPARNPILPGMVVDADIVTGSKSLLQYLLKPVYRGLSNAFRER